jgi:hypothetical protein
MRAGICKFCIVAPDRVVAKLLFIAGVVGVLSLLCVVRVCRCRNALFCCQKAGFD